MAGGYFELSHADYYLAGHGLAEGLKLWMGGVALVSWGINDIIEGWKEEVPCKGTDEIRIDTNKYVTLPVLVPRIIRVFQFLIHDPIFNRCQVTKRFMGPFSVVFHKPLVCHFSYF